MSMMSIELIHSANPQSMPVGIIIFAHVVRQSVGPHFSKLVKQNKVNTMFTTGKIVGLAEWINSILIILIS